MIKKIVCAALTTALLISSAVGVMAASYSTTTTYGDVAGEIEVSSTITGVAVGDTLTYLAHEDANANGTMEDTEVVYIDQIVADETTETFSYVTDKADINATVLYGGKTAAGAAMAVSNTTKIPGMIKVMYDGTVIAQGCGKDVGAGYVKVAFVGGCIGGYDLEDGVDGFRAADGFWINTSVLDGKEEATVNAVLADTVVSATTYDIKEFEGSILVLGNATGDGAYGAEISSGADFVTPLANADDVAFEAAGRNADGDFLIELDYGDEVPAGTYYARAYAGTAKANPVNVTVVEAAPAE